jgi:asparagine synthase (glutamine-hydrolysing)
VCGIAGKASASGAVDEALLERMCARIEHRGPDSRGTFRDAGIGLGIQRLRVIDLQTGDQPIENEDGSVVVILNGEIYNYAELREGLRARGHHFSTQGDTEVIVHLYEEHGVDCVQHLRGMFAFALWDRTRRRLLLARDRLGKKPLFYRAAGGELWFASEVRAILEDPDVPRRMNLRAVDAFLQYQYVPHPLSAFDGIEKLPPAHTLVWQEGQVEIGRYWQLSHRPHAQLPTRAEAQEEIRRLLLEATALRLRSDVPLGAFLSGGVDSSAVVAAMAKQASGAVQTFAIGFDVESYDETRWAREVAELYGTDHHELRVEPHAIDVLPKLVWHYGEPFADHSAIPSFYLSELTREHVTVALNGDGGDENFAGYTRYVGNAIANRIGRLPLPVRRALALAGRVAGVDVQDSSFRSRLRRVSERALLGPAERYALWMSIFDERSRRDLYTPEFLAELGSLDAERFVAAAFTDSDAEDDVNRLLHVDVETYLPGDLLVKMDIATMAHSLEVRSPLLDHVFMEYVAGLPGAWKLEGQTTKKLFKDALRPWLPDHILDRPKWGFGVPIADWFAGALRDLPREILLDERSLARGLFRPDEVRRLIDGHGVDGTNNADRLWALIQLELWQRTFLDELSPEPLALDARVAA